MGLSSRAGAFALACVLVLGGCGDSGKKASPDDVPKDAPGVSAPGMGIAGALPRFSTSDTSADRQGEWDLVLSGVRVGSHPRFDRVVLEFRGEGKPGWAVNYVDSPRLDGSGKRVRMRGRTFIDVHARGATMRADGSETGEWDFYTGPARLTPEGRIAAIHVTEGPFEGDHQVLLGIRGGKTPFRVFGLSSPTRLVLDVKSPA